METQAINSTLSSNPKYKRTAKVAAVAAGVGGGLSGIGNYAGQKIILNNADLYKDIYSSSNMEDTKAIIKDIYADSKPLQEKVLKTVKEQGDYVKNLLERGKVSGGEVVKSALKGAAKTGIIIGGIYFIGKTIKDFVTKDK